MRRRGRPAAFVAAAVVAGLAVVGVVGTAWANGGIVRVAEAPVGPWLVTVYSSPTPLRTGEVDISTLVLDSANRTMDVPITVTATPMGFVADPVRQPATRRQATNKLFKAAKFDIDVPGRWTFRVHLGSAATEPGRGAEATRGAEGRGGGGGVSGGVGADPESTEDPGGTVSFEAVVARSTILDRPFLLAVMIALPLLLVGWLLLGRESEPVRQVDADVPG